MISKLLALLLVLGTTQCWSEEGPPKFSICGIEPGMTFAQATATHPKLSRNTVIEDISFPLWKNYIDQDSDIMVSISNQTGVVEMISGNSLSCSSSDFPALDRGLPIAALSQYFRYPITYNWLCQDGQLSFNSGTQQVYIRHDWKLLRRFRVATVDWDARLNRD